MTAPVDIPKRFGRRFPAEEEEAALAVFKATLKQKEIAVPPELVYGGDEDATLLRFLRARKLDQKLALDMFLACLQWRKENDVDTIFNRPLPQETLNIIRKNKPASYIGFDRQRRPLYVDRVGLLNEPGIRGQGVTLETVVKYHIQEMEYMGRILLAESSAAAGVTIDKCSMLMDVKGVSMSMFTKYVREVFGALSKIDSDNYPETLGLIFVVNAGVVFRTIWKVLQGFLDSHTASKIKVLGASQADLAVLREHLDDAMIPSFLGGTCDFEQQRIFWTKKMDDAIYNQARPPSPSGPAAEDDAEAPARAPGEPNAAGRLSGEMDPEVRIAVGRIDDLIGRLKDYKGRMQRKSSRRNSRQASLPGMRSVPEDQELAAVAGGKEGGARPGCKCTVM